MAGRTAQNAASPKPGQELVAPEAFSPPQLTRASQWQRSWRAARRWLSGREGQKARAEREASLVAPGEAQLARWLRPPAASLLASALERCLADTEAPVVVLVTPPHGGHAAAVAELARTRGVTRLTPPAPGALLNGDTDWMASLSTRSRWAVPALERHFLRRVDGLSGVREFLERAQTGALGRGIIGCDSWSHAYLKHAVGLEGLPVVTPQALDGHALGKRLAATLGPDCPTLLSSRTHQPLLPGSDGTPGDTRSLQRLAADCRGHEGLALGCFRDSLRMADTETGTEGGGPDTLWYVRMQADPALPLEADDALLLVLHALLIHGGLDDESLCRVLPFSRHEALQTRLELSHLGVLCQREGRFQVAPLCYTGVRQLLETRRYLLDAL